MLAFLGNMIVFISICISYQNSNVLAFYLFIFIIISTQEESLGSAPEQIFGWGAI